MTEQEQQKLAAITKTQNVFWSPDENTCLKVMSVTNRADEHGLCANFSGGQYAALDGCEPNDFLVGERLSISEDDT